LDPGLVWLTSSGARGDKAFDPHHKFASHSDGLLQPTELRARPAGARKLKIGGRLDFDEGTHQWRQPVPLGRFSHASNGSFVVHGIYRCPQRRPEDRVCGNVHVPRAVRISFEVAH
jgi:hypothetical protein